MIFNALIIIALIPLALRGVKYRPVGAGCDAAPQPADLRRRRLIVPFIGIKLIDVILTALHAY